MRLLYCGADGAMLGALEGRFTRRGHLIARAADRADAREQARTRAVDALVLEVERPDDPFLEDLLALAPEVRVLAIGPDDTSLAAARARAHGAFGYVGAPRGPDPAVVEALAPMVERLTARLRLDAERRRDLEESLRTRKFYEDVLTSVGQGIVVVDQDGRLRYRNPEAARVLGEDEGASSPLAGQTAVPLLQALVDTIAEGSPRQRSIAQEVDDQKVFLDVATSVLRGTDGRAAGAIAIVSDRSLEKRLEEQLIHTERLATLGSLLASIAHEIMNVLTSVTGCAEVGLEIASEAEQAGEAAQDPGARAALAQLSGDIRGVFDTVLQAGVSAQTIANNMLQYSRQAAPTRLVKHDLNDLIRRTLKMLGKHLGTDKVTLALDLDPGSPSARLEPSKLQQALVNLVVNAVDALQDVPPERRHLRIETRRDLERREVVVAVDDQGPGIPAKRLERIFQPFFTTKGHGTGLGLYITRKVVQDQGGTLEVQSRPGEGTRFTIRLPLE